MAKEVKAVIFDVGSVLVLEISHYRNSSSGPRGPHELVRKELGLTLDQYINAVAPVFQDSTRGQISNKDTIEILSKNLGISKTKVKQVYLEAHKKTSKKNNELSRKIKQLKKQGYKTAILSDQWHMSRDIRIDSIETKNFDKIMISCDEGMRKPEEKFFKLALKRLRVKPSEALFIDDQKWNTDAARKLGFQTILFKNNERLFKHPKWRKLFK